MTNFLHTTANTCVDPVDPQPGTWLEREMDIRGPRHDTAPEDRCGVPGYDGAGRSDAERNAGPERGGEWDGSGDIGVVEQPLESWSAELADA
jgi:hypothetical protein